MRAPPSYSKQWAAARRLPRPSAHPAVPARPPPRCRSSPRAPTCASSCTCRRRAGRRACSTACGAGTAGRRTTSWWRTCAQSYRRWPSGAPLLGVGRAPAAGAAPASLQRLPRQGQRRHLPCVTRPGPPSSPSCPPSHQSICLTPFVPFLPVAPPCSTDMIVGFCGEREEDHAASLGLMRAVGYDQAFLFAYSMRDKTHAARHYQVRPPARQPPPPPRAHAWPGVVAPCLAACQPTRRPAVFELCVARASQPMPGDCGSMLHAAAPRTCARGSSSGPCSRRWLNWPHVCPSLPCPLCPIGCRTTCPRM